MFLLPLQLRCSPPLVQAILCDLQMLDKFPSILTAVALQMFIRILQYSIELIPCGGKPKYSRRRWRRMNLRFVYDRFSILQQFLYLRLLEPTQRTTWSGECFRLALRLAFIAFEVALQNNLTTARWPTAFSSFLQHIFVFVKEAPIDRVVHQCCSHKCSLHVQLHFQNG